MGACARYVRTIIEPSPSMKIGRESENAGWLMVYESVPLGETADSLEVVVMAPPPVMASGDDGARFECLSLGSSIAKMPHATEAIAAMMIVVERQYGTNKQSRAASTSVPPSSYTTEVSTWK